MITRHKHLEEAYTRTLQHESAATYAFMRSYLITEKPKRARRKRAAMIEGLQEEAARQSALARQYLFQLIGS